MATLSTIHSLMLQDFRSFPKTEFLFDAHQTLLLGPNGIGKTNILEAISLFSTGMSVRGMTLAESVRRGSEVAHVTVTAMVDGEDEQLQVTIVAKENSLGSRANTKYKRNGVAKRKSDVVGVLKSVIFRPEDVEIITGSPSKKRNLLDVSLMQVSSNYRRAISEYERALKHRNKLILQLREGLVTRRDFVFWDELLIKHADLITRERARFIHFVNDLVTFPIPGFIDYDKSLMTSERLHQYAVAEVGAGKTLVGPHRDSLIIKQQLKADEEPIDVAGFGSRGQQRMAILWLKIAQLQFIETETDISPVLLLDDVFSELDEQNREILFSLFQNHQVILTSAEELVALPPEVKQGKVLSI